MSTRPTKIATGQKVYWGQRGMQIKREWRATGVWTKCVAGSPRFSGVSGGWDNRKSKKARAATGKILLGEALKRLAQVTTPQQGGLQGAGKQGTKRQGSAQFKTKGICGYDWFGGFLDLPKSEEGKPTGGQG